MEPSGSAGVALKLVIFGSRDAFPSLQEVDAALDWIDVPSLECVLSGCASGADYCGERWANERGVRVVPYAADWVRYGKRAGPMRNARMAADADIGLGFWRGESSGTANMAAHLLLRGKPVKLVEWSRKAEPDLFRQKGIFR